MTVGFRNVLYRLLKKFPTISASNSFAILGINTPGGILEAFIQIPQEPA
jgi:hypothetical protein